MKFPFVLRSTHERILKTNRELRVEKSRLEQELIKARKNDNRDPETGRYVKGE